MKRVLLFSILCSCFICVSFADFDINYDSSSSKINVEIDNKNSSANKEESLSSGEKAYLRVENNSVINNDSYDTKNKADEEIYKKYREELGEDYYTLYRIIERILRANKLDYQNWRIEIVRETEEFNAFSTAGNLIAVNSALLDTYFDNENALAFVLGHEIGHLILKHQRASNINHKKAEVLRNISQKSKREMNRWDTSYTEDTVNGIAALTSELAMYNAYRQIRKLEFDADEKAVELVSKAGYNPRVAADVFDFISNMTGVYTLYDSHPDEKSRVDKVNKIINSTDLNSLKKEGQKNLYNSQPLGIRKSSDRKTFIITRASSSYDANYDIDNKEER